MRVQTDPLPPPPDAEADAPMTTVRDVARAAGVSQSAVSRAFTPGASIAESTRKRVLVQAERLGYRPNQLARSLINGRSDLVGVGVGNLRNPFFCDTLELLSVELDRAGYRLLLFTCDDDAQLRSSINQVLHYRLHALILLSTTLTSTLATECRMTRVPVILYNRVTADPAISSVVGGNDLGARSIAGLLMAGGHERLAFIAGLDHSSTSRQREASFFQYVAERGGPEPLREAGHFTFEDAAAATRRLLARRDRPDAIFCANDQMALAAINVARHEFGLEVGRSISIAGFDDVPMAAWPTFSLTTFRQPTGTMVARTVDIIHQLREEPRSVTSTVVEGELVVRGSTRPIR